jgi:predicted nucleic acid-binding protein
MPGRQLKWTLLGALVMLNAVVDTGPLIHLHEIDRLAIITAVFSKLHLPEYVEREIHNEPILQFIYQNTAQIIVHPIPEPELFSTKDAFSAYQLHLADLAVLTLLTKFDGALAATDDLALRRAIESNGRTVVGSIGILFRAYKQGVIDKPQLADLIDKIFNDSTLYLNIAFRARVQTIIESLT